MCQSRIQLFAPLLGSAFFLMLGYECIRSSSSSLFLEKYSASLLPNVLLFIPLLLLTVLYIYNWLLSRVGPRKTLVITTVVASGFIFITIVLISMGLDDLRLFLVLLSEVYIMILVEQYWAFVDSTVDVSFAKKFNGLFTGIGTLGSILGGLLAGKLAATLGTTTLVYLSAASLLPVSLLGDLAYRASPLKRVEVHRSEPLSFGWAQLREIPILKMLLAIVLSTQVLATVLTLSFQNMLQTHYPGLDSRTAYSGNFYAALNAVCLLLQFLGVPLALRYFRPILVQAFIPMINLGFALWVLFHPTLLSVGMALLVFKVMDYSLFRATKEILYIPLSFEARFRSKGIIDIFGYRFSKGFTSLLLLLLRPWIVLGTTVYSSLGMVALGVWIGCLFGFSGRRK